MIRSYSGKSNNLRTLLRESNGSVLASVLIVSVALFILASTVLFFMTSKYSVHQRLHNRTAAHYLAESALNRFLSTSSYSQLFLPSDTGRSPNHGTLWYEPFAWGPHILVRAGGSVANQTVDIWAVVGTKSDSLFRGAITTTNTHFPVVAAGDTRITGDIYTGPLGIQTGQFRGEAPTSESFHQGRVYLRQYFPPAPSATTTLARYVSDLGRRREMPGRAQPGTSWLKSDDVRLFDSDSIHLFENNLRIESLTYSSAKRLSLFVGGRVELVGCTRLSGPIEIIAVGPIYVEDSTVLDGTLLYSPDSIILNDETTFLGTAVSRRATFVGGSAQLQFPATVYVEAEENSGLDSISIQLASNEIMEAVCMLAGSPASTDTTRAQVYLDTNATFQGYIVSPDQADIRGTVRGSIYTRQFLYPDPPTTYVNWLKDARIYRRMLLFDPPMPIATSEDSVRLAIARMFP